MKKILQVFLVSVLLLLACLLFLYTPFQDVRVTARTGAGNYTLSGETDVYVIRPLKAGQSYHAELTFEAVPSSSGKLFTSFGSGPSVRYGCSPLTASVDFISVGRFALIHLSMYVPGEYLTLEDGSPFDLSRYSLKPVFTIEER